MKILKNLFLITILLIPVSVYGAGANDFRISDNDGDVLDINPDGTIPIAAPIPSTETIIATATITANACGGVKKITAAGSVTTNTTDTFTTPATANLACCMDVINVGTNAITLDTNTNFKSIGAADIVLGANDAARVCSTGLGGFWYSTADTANN